MSVGLGKNLLTLITGQAGTVSGVRPAAVRVSGMKYPVTNPVKGDVCHPESRNQIGSNVTLPGYNPNALGSCCYYLA